MENTTQQQQQPPPPQQQQYVQEQYQQQQYFAGDAGQPMAVGVQQDGAQVVDQSGTAFGDGQEFPGSLQVGGAQAVNMDAQEGEEMCHDQAEQQRQQEDGGQQPQPEFYEDKDGSMQVGDDSVPVDDHKLFVGGLNWDTTESTLHEYFSQFGNVNSVNLKYDNYTKRSRGFAFVVFNDSDAVDKVINEGPHIIDGKEIDYKKAIPHAIHQQMKHRNYQMEQRTKKIFVGGVPTELPAEPIREYFSQFGKIEEVTLVTEKESPHKRRGFCFVIFENEESADKCCETKFHALAETAVEVKKAIPRDQDKHHGGGGGGGGGRGRSEGRGYGGPRGGGYHWDAPYGGYAAYYPPPYYPPPYQPYGGYGGYPYPRRDDPGYYGSRYGPKKSYGGHYTHNGPSYHPYSR